MGGKNRAAVAAAVATTGLDEAKNNFFSVILVLERWQRTLGASCNWAHYLATTSTGSSTQKIFAPEPENMFIEVVKSGQVLAAAREWHEHHIAMS